MSTQEMPPIKRARNEAGLTQRELAAWLEIPVRNIERWDAENASPPKWVEKLLVEKIKRDGKKHKASIKKERP